MKILPLYISQNNQKRTNPHFTAKIETQFLLESISQNMTVKNENDKLLRLTQISDVTGIPLKKLQNKLSNRINFKMFFDTFGCVVQDDFPKLSAAAVDYTADLISTLLEGKIKSISDLSKVMNKYERKYGKFTDVNLDEGQKSFFSKYIDLL